MFYIPVKFDILDILTILQIFFQENVQNLSA